MHRRKALFVLAAAAGLLPALATLQAQQQSTDQAAPPTQSPSEVVFQVRSESSTITLTEQSSKIVEHSARIKSVDGHDPKVIDVQAISPTQIRIHGLESGVTDIVLTDEFDKRYQVEVFVVGDVRHLQKLLKHLYPHSSIRVIEVKGSVILDGWMTQPEHINQAIEIAETFYNNVMNHMQVGGVQQVLLQCQILEVQRSKMRRLGVNFLANGQNGYLVSTPGALTPVTELAVTPATGAEVSLSGFGEATLSFGVFNSNRIFQAFVQALRDEGMLKLQSVPSVVTTNGAPANILSGGEVPIVVPAGLGTVAIEFRSFGIQLDAVPIILGDGRVRLKLRPEVSERDFSSSVTVSGIAVPGFTVRRAETQVEMRFGETLAIGGLVSRRETQSATKVPLFGELPWVGTMFSRKTSEMSETELVILITPQYASGIKPGHMPPGGPGQFTDQPMDKELFFHNMIEVPKYGSDCEYCQDGTFALPGGIGNCSHCRGGAGSACGRCAGCRNGGACASEGCAPQAAMPQAPAPPESAGAARVAPTDEIDTVAREQAPMPPADADEAGIEEALPGLIEGGIGGSR